MRVVILWDHEHVRRLDSLFHSSANPTQIILKVLTAGFVVSITIQTAMMIWSLVRVQGTCLFRHI